MVKKGGLFDKGGALHGFPGPKCSLCCLIFSFFGVIVLIAIGILLSEPYQKVEGENLVEDHTAQERKATAYITAGIYAGFVLLCAGRVVYIRRCRPPPPKGDDDDEGM